MSTQRAALGTRGEDLAAERFVSLGFNILARNHRCRRGEVDLIAEKGELLVFAEVRARSSSAFGSPEETVDAAKQKRVVIAARDYLARTGGPEREIRFDVIAVIDALAGPIVRHLPNAFDAGGY